MTKLARSPSAARTRTSPVWSPGRSPAGEKVRGEIGRARVIGSRIQFVGNAVAVRVGIVRIGGRGHAAEQTCQK